MVLPKCKLIFFAVLFDINAYSVIPFSDEFHAKSYSCDTNLLPGGAMCEQPWWHKYHHLCGMCVWMDGRNKIPHGNTRCCGNNRLITPGWRYAIHRGRVWLLYIDVYYTEMGPNIRLASWCNISILLWFKCQPDEPLASLVTTNRIMDVYGFLVVMML